MRSLVVLALVSTVGVVPVLAAAAATPATTQILQQRTADGRLLLTDRPAPGARTERTWQMQNEDPVAARQRAHEVKAEAQLVTERVQRHIEQQRRFDEEDRLRMARLDLDRERAELDRDRAYGGGVLLYPTYGLYGARRGYRGDRVDGGGARRDHGGHRDHGGARPPRGPFPPPLRGSAGPGSR